MATIYGANTLSSGYDVANSLRFNGDNFLQRNNPSSNSTDGTKGTFSFWVKRDKFPNESQVLIHQADSSTKRFALQIANNDEFIFSIRNDAESVDIDGTTTLDTVYRDTSAWYHFLFNYDTSGGTNGCKLFVNGAEQALSYSATLPQNFVMTVNTNGFSNHTIGRDSTQSSNFWTGYMTEVMFVDGQQLAPTQFGEYDEDTPTVWKPKDISGINVGNLGYYLDFEDASNLGNDVKGVGDFSETNCATTDQCTDTCTNNFATFNGVLNYSSTMSLAEGNLKGTTGSSHEAFYQSFFSSIGVSAGKWYAEFKVTAQSNHSLIGISADLESDANGSSGSAYSFIYKGQGIGYYGSNGKFFHTDSNTQVTYGSALSNNDIVGVAMDVDNQEVYFSINGTFQNSGDPTSGSSKTGGCIGDEGARNIFSTGTGTLFFAVADFDQSAQCVFEANFGGGSVSAISSGNADANGHGNFEYAVPSGYFALCTKNLAEHG